MFFVWKQGLYGLQISTTAPTHHPELPSGFFSFFRRDYTFDNQIHEFRKPSEIRSFFLPSPKKIKTVQILGIPGGGLANMWFAKYHIISHTIAQSHNIAYLRLISQNIPYVFHTFWNALRFPPFKRNPKVVPPQNKTPVKILQDFSPSNFLFLESGKKKADSLPRAEKIKHLRCFSLFKLALNKFMGRL